MMATIQAAAPLIARPDLIIANSAKVVPEAGG